MHKACHANPFTVVTHSASVCLMLSRLCEVGQYYMVKVFNANSCYMHDWSVCIAVI